MSELIPKPKTNFVEVKCASCGNTQAVFSSPVTKVKCLVCEKNLLIPNASKAEFNAKVTKTLDNDLTGKEFKLTRGNRRKLSAKKLSEKEERIEEAKEGKPVEEKAEEKKEEKPEEKPVEEKKEEKVEETAKTEEVKEKVGEVKEEKGEVAEEKPVEVKEEVKEEEKKE